MRLGLMIPAIATLLLAGCHHERARPPSLVQLSRDNHELRDAFNLDADDARVIMLVSPS